jgi:hypothetical protein
MPENLGTIFAEVRIELEKLKGDTAKAQKYISTLEIDLKKSAADAGKSAGQGFFSGLKKGFDDTATSAKKLGANIAKQLSPALVGLAAGIKGIQGIGNALKDALLSNEKFKNGIDTLKSELGESFSASVRPVSDFFAGIITHIAKALEQSNRLKDALKHLKDGTESYGDTLGEQLEKTQRDFNAVDTQIKKINESIANAHGHGRSSLTTLNQQLKELLPVYDELKAKLEELMGTTGDANAAAIKKFEGIEKEFMDTEKQIALLREKNAIDDKERDQMRLSALNNYINSVSKLASEEKIESGIVIESLEKQIAEREDLEKRIATQSAAVNRLAQAQEQYQKTLAQVQAQERAGFISTAQAQEKRLAAENQYITALTGLKNEYTALGTLTDEQTVKIKTQTDAHMAQASAIQKVLDYEKQYNDEVARLKTDYEKISAELGVQESFTELMQSETVRRTAELEKQRDAELAELKTRYAIIEAERGGAGLTQAEIKNRAQLTEAINQNYDAMRKIENSRGIIAAQKEIISYGEEIADQYRDITRTLAEQDILQNDKLTDAQKERAINELNRKAALDELAARYDALKAQRGGIALSKEEVEEQKRITAAINKNFDAIQDGIRKTTSGGGSVIEQIVGSDYYKVGEAAVQAYQAVFSAIIEITQRQAREEIEIIESTLSETLETINTTTKAAIEDVDKLLKESSERLADQRQAALEEAGFAESKRAEDMQAAIDAAMEAGDEILQYQLRRRQEELRINNEYDDKEKAAKEKAEADKRAIEEKAQAEREAAEADANKKKADAEYKAAQIKYKLDISTAITTGAMAITNAVAAGWSIGGPAAPALAAAFGAAAGVSTGAQMAVIMSNPPKLGYATGGIVPGQDYGHGDTVSAMLTPGEVILNQAQQETLAPKIGGTIHIQMMLDGRLIGETIVNDYINNGIILIEAKRGIR